MLDKMLRQYGQYYDELQNHQRKMPIQQILTKEHITEWDLFFLLQPCELSDLELMARKAHALTRQYFGSTIQLYAPLYLSNYCINQCVYCGFGVNNKIPRRKLSMMEMRKEVETLHHKGFRDVVLLTGEAPRQTPLNYLAEAVAVTHAYIPHISIEMFPMTEEEYGVLRRKGATGLTIYQEVYNRDCYKHFHLTGPKKEYEFRLTAPDRAARQGFHHINIGALLGLDNPRKEVFLMAMHLQYLEKTYPHVEFSVSFPRLTSTPASFHPPHPVTDQMLAQFIAAIRIFSPRTGINLSTRESAFLRDHLLPWGVTKMSAESKTTVGGYSDAVFNESPQFEIHDNRSVNDVVTAIKSYGFQPIFKDWEST